MTRRHEKGEKHTFSGIALDLLTAQPELTNER